MTFVVGDTVRVSTRSHDGHHRTPAYLKGKAGTIDRLHGRFENPETRAYDGDGLPERELYLVRFDLADEHCVLADVFEHWLERPS